MIPRILDFLREQHPFTLLTEAERERVDATASARTFADGARILEQDGTRSDCLYLLVDGQVRLVRDGEELQVLEEGDCFGYPSMINRAAPAFDVVAAGEVQVHCVPEAVFRELLGNAAFAEFFLHSLGERLQRVTGASVTALGGELTTELGDLELRAVVQVPPGATVAEAARAMRDARDDFALVAGTPPGIVTDHDFQVKVLAEGLGPDTPVARVMTRPLKTLPSDTPVHGALLYMLEERIHHLPVLREGHIIGVLTATDLLRHQTTNPLYLMRRVEHLDRDTTLATYSRDAAAMVERLFRGGLKVGQIGRVFASLNDALIRRLCRLAEVDLGPPPCPYAWLVFGSEGRMEQALLTDQDNALVYARDDTGAPEYFARLAARVVGDLVTAGFPPCPGGCMATNWNKPLAAWEETIRGWIDEPTPDNLMVSSIFFDYRAVAGTLDVAALDDRITAAAGNQLFMAHLARVSLRFKPPLGLFQQIQATDDKVDLKKRSIAPIVAAARVYGLEAGTRARPTRERLEAAIEAGVVSRDLGQTLIETYRFLLQLRLREQLAAVAGGGAPDNDVNLKALSSLQRRHLKDAFGVIREMQGAVARRYRTSALG
ncbi:MAG: cyclic nucleotide-binding/CBS domain-containing protein [bacterium]|nr:cyclic nucleotide-binding/CBS domain-containing protein [bacterium]MBK7673071.1 cyclic nucleotide-binding/CBS domain-containing protein [bacterium]